MDNNQLQLMSKSAQAVILKGIAQQLLQMNVPTVEQLDKLLEDFGMVSFTIAGKDAVKTVISNQCEEIHQLKSQIKPSLIGTYYTPRDNSYAQNITKNHQYPGYDAKYFSERNSYSLAGIRAFGRAAVSCKVISEPFSCNIQYEAGKEFKQKQMIMVEAPDGTAHCVMYHPD